MKLKNKLKIGGFLFPFGTGCLLFYLIPFGMTIWLAFHKGAGRNSKFVGTANFTNLFQSKIFLLALSNTAVYLLICLPLILLISLGLAVLLKEHAKKWRILKSVIMFPYIMPAAGCIMFYDVLTSRIPEADGSSIVLMIGWYIWKNTGYNVILIVSGLVRIPECQYESARMDGAGPLGQLIYVTIPQIMDTLLFTLIFSLVHAYSSFREIFLIGGTHPDSDLYMLQHFINNGFEQMNYPSLAAACIICFVPLGLAAGIIYRLLERKREGL